ncbi:50S ribosomal protein L19 [bacterium]|nr:50S ribosomal protein L19 [bacterium]
MAIRRTEDVEAFLAERQREVPDFRSGDTLKVLYKENDGEKSQPLQTFIGVCTARHGGMEVGATFTLRKESHKVGVEKTFPLHSPRLEKVEVVRKGKVRRAKLKHLRGLSRRQSRIKERK